MIGLWAAQACMPAVFAKELLSKGAPFLFTYNDLKIISAVPLSDIKAYLHELGAQETSELIYEYSNLEIEISVGINDALATLKVPQYAIHVRGDRGLAETFLTDFRFRFLSAGG